MDRTKRTLSRPDFTIIATGLSRLIAMGSAKRIFRRRCRVPQALTGAM